MVGTSRSGYRKDGMRRDRKIGMQKVFVVLDFSDFSDF